MTVDARCLCDACERRTTDTYVMSGACRNCKTADIWITYRRGDSARDVDCPQCGCARTVHPSLWVVAVEGGPPDNDRSPEARMVRVHLTAPALDVIDFDATGWSVDTDRGFLTVTKDDRQVAVFAHAEWAYVTDGTEAADA